MSQPSRSRPPSSEHLAYYSRYIDLVPEGDILDVLGAQMGTTSDMLRAIPEARGDFRYAPEKWSVKEVIGHVMDAERIFAYRALRFARADRTPLPGFEQDPYIGPGAFGRRRLTELAEELQIVRTASLALFASLPDEAWPRSGIANGAEMSVRAVAYAIAGHELHHRSILQTRYL